MRSYILKVLLKDREFGIIAYVVIIAMFIFIGDDKRIVIPFFLDDSKNILIFITASALLVVTILLGKRVRKIRSSAFLTTFFLLLYCVIMVLSIVYNNAWYGWAGNVTSVLLCAISFCIFSRVSIATIKVILDKINPWACLIVMVQVIATSVILLQTNISAQALNKESFAIPLGISNSIAIFLVPMFVSTMIKSHKRRIDYLSMFACFASILILMNRSGIFTIIIMAIIYRSRISNNISRSKLMAFFVAPLVAILIILNIGLVNEWISNYLFARGNTYRGNDWILDEFSSGRIRIIIDKLILIVRKPLLGYGAGYASELDVAMRAHNWIVECMERTGILGLFSYIVAIYFPFKSIAKARKEFEIGERLVAIAKAILIISLIEPALFSPRTDFIFGATLGMMILVSYSYRTSIGNSSTKVFVTTK